MGDGRVQMRRLQGGRVPAFLALAACVVTVLVDRKTLEYAR